MSKIPHKSLINIKIDIESYQLEPNGFIKSRPKSTKRESKLIIFKGNSLEESHEQALDFFNSIINHITKEQEQREQREKREKNESSTSK